MPTILPRFPVFPAYRNLAAKILPPAPPPGGTVFTVDVVDGVFMDDGTVKGRESTQNEGVLLNDNFNELIHDLTFQDEFFNSEVITKISDLLKMDSVFLNDAFTKFIREMILKEAVFLSSNVLLDLDKKIIEYVLLADVVSKVWELNFLDYHLLYDSGGTDAGTVINLLLTDYILLLDEIVKTQETTNKDSILTGDATLRELLKELTDSVLASDDSQKLFELTASSYLLVGEVVTRLRELTLQEGIVLNSITDAQITLVNTAALVYAKVRMRDYLGITIGAIRQ